MLYQPAYAGRSPGDPVGLTLLALEWFTQLESELELKGLTLQSLCGDDAPCSILFVRK
jgi:hypothetical protein